MFSGPNVLLRTTPLVTQKKNIDMATGNVDMNKADRAPTFMDLKA